MFLEQSITVQTDVIHRQTLTFTKIMKTPVELIRADYLPRGSLQYEFGSELLQTPIQLLRITNAEAQVTLEICPFHSFYSSCPVQLNVGNVLIPNRLLRL